MRLYWPEGRSILWPFATTALWDPVFAGASWNCTSWNAIRAGGREVIGKRHWHGMHGRNFCLQRGQSQREGARLIRRERSDLGTAVHGRGSDRLFLPVDFTRGADRRL